MADAAYYEQSNAPELNESHYLTEVDHLNRFRMLDGRHSPFALGGVRQNLIPAVKEAAMPYAESTTYQEYRNGDYMWLDQTPEQVAMSGYEFHEHPAALARVDVEMEEASDTRHLEPGVIKVFISPRMSKKDAPYATAKQEHLADDDMIRIHMVDMGEDELPRGKYMQSVLVRHVPLSAWVNMLRDPHNIFGKAISVEDEESALSVMKVHRELRLPEAALPKGVISIIEAVLPYADAAAQAKIREELALFGADQQELHRKAESIAERWLNFEMALADSLHYGYATETIQNFVRGLAFEWSEDFADELMENTSPNGDIRMTRSLAAKLEASKQNALWVSGGVITDNKRILRQLDSGVAQQIYINELFIQTAMREGASAQSVEKLEITNDKVVAQQNVTAGGGCPGSGKGFFGSSQKPDKPTSGETADKKCPEIKNGQRVKCPGCKEQVKAIVPNRETIYCSNPKCNLAAPHLKRRQPKHEAAEAKVPQLATETAHAEKSSEKTPEASIEQEVEAAKEKQAKPLGALALQA